MRAALSVGILLTGSSPWAAGCAHRSGENSELTSGTATEVCEPHVAWDAFEELLRTSYAYVDRSDFDVDAQLAHSRKAITSARSSGEVRGILLRTTYAFTDPHLLVGPLSDDAPNVIYTSSDMVVRREGADYRVTQVRNDSPAQRSGIRPGWVLAEVQGMNLGAAIDQLVGRIIVNPNQRQLDYAATLLVNGRRTGVRTLTFLVDGRRRELSLANPREFAKSVAKRDLVTVHRMHDDVTVVRFENSLGNLDTIAAFDRAVESALDSEWLAIDLRNTPSGGNTDVARSVIGHFIQEARPYQLHRIPAVERRTSVPREFLEFAVPRMPYFGGKVVAIGGPWTGSMGEGLVIGLDGAAGVRTFATDMGDLLGALYTERLGACDAFVEFGAEALFHINGTPRESYVADEPLECGDIGPDGTDAGMRAVTEWVAAH